MTTLVFGHKSPDTDATGSAIIWAWYLAHTGEEAEPRVLGTPSAEALFVLDRWGVAVPPLLENLPEGTPVVVVDTNNPAELPDGINKADIRAVIDHHKLTGGLETRGPIEMTIRPVASTATLLYQLMDGHAGHAPEAIKGLILSCILSDTLEFRSPTTTEVDRRIAGLLARDLGIDIPAYAAEMFAAKSDVSGLSDAELLRIDSKEYTVDGVRLRVAVIETTAPEPILARIAGLAAAMPQVAAEDDADQVLLFVVDILREQATLVTPNALARTIAEKSFGVSATGDSVLLPGVMSRKKQIVPVLRVN
ncbi:MAG: manganese-dependent inorganic pyrophosphatase [Rubellimicrobium sp.]|nr:manganese-dependent inorganic pyrophosphatase [Rubellimicrobium sp.]